VPADDNQVCGRKQTVFDHVTVSSHRVISLCHLIVSRPVLWYLVCESVTGMLRLVGANKQTNGTVVSCWR